LQSRFSGNGLDYLIHACDVRERECLRSWGYPLGIEGRDSFRMLKDLGKLLLEEGLFFLRQSEAR
jgi:hypothetical protein